jgi:hypothetical protein
MSFAQMLKDDLEQVIFNPDEFGDQITWNGVQVPCKKEELQGEASEGGPGVLLKELKVGLVLGSVSTPKPDSQVELDGHKWLVRSTGVKGQKLTVFLYRHLS